MMLHKPTLKLAARMGILAGLLTLVSCSDKPSEQQCIDAHLHNVKVVAEDPTMPDDMREVMLQRVLNKEIAPAMITSCMEKKTKKQVECEMKAESMPDLMKCKQFQREADKAIKGH